MTEIINLSVSDVLPSKEDVLNFQGIQNINKISGILIENLELSMMLLKEKSLPIAIIQECTKSDFMD
ncbi:MAG: hypothetical protein V3S42_04090, partial [Candidatus Neomarinimicrobiota bacterium]